MMIHWQATLDVQVSLDLKVQVIALHFGKLRLHLVSPVTQHLDPKTKETHLLVCQRTLPMALGVVLTSSLCSHFPVSASAVAAK